MAMVVVEVFLMAMTKGTSARAVRMRPTSYAAWRRNKMGVSTCTQALGFASHPRGSTALTARSSWARSRSRSSHAHSNWRSVATARTVACRPSCARKYAR